MRAAAAFALWASAAAAGGPDPTGVWRVTGVDPGGSAYSGRATVTAEGEAYRVRWVVDGVAFEGVGLLVEGRLSVAFFDRFEGIAVYASTVDGWSGPWTAVASAGARGRETWTR